MKQKNYTEWYGAKFNNYYSIVKIMYRQKYWRTWEVLSTTNDELVKLFPEVKIRPVKLGVMEFLHDNDRLYTQITFFNSFIQHIANNDDYRSSLNEESQKAILHILDLDYKECKSYVSSLSNTQLEEIKYHVYAINEMANRVYYGKLDIDRAFSIIPENRLSHFYQILMTLEIKNRLESHGTYIDLYEKSFQLLHRSIAIKTLDLFVYGTELELNYFADHMCAPTFKDLTFVFNSTNENRTRFIIQFLTKRDLIDPCVMLSNDQFILSEVYMTPSAYKTFQTFAILCEQCNRHMVFLDEHAEKIFNEIHEQV